MGKTNIRFKFRRLPRALLELLAWKCQFQIVCLQKDFCSLRCGYRLLLTVCIPYRDDSTPNWFNIKLTCCIEQFGYFRNTLQRIKPGINWIQCAVFFLSCCIWCVSCECGCFFVCFSACGNANKSKINDEEKRNRKIDLAWNGFAVQILTEDRMISKKRPILSLYKFHIGCCEIQCICYTDQCSLYCNVDANGVAHHTAK